jgi:hypothetical protein
LKKNFKGFTLIELSMSLLLMLFLAFISKPYIISMKLNSDMDDSFKFLSTFVNSYIYDPNIGYLNMSGGKCSSNYSAVGIDLKKVLECVKKDNVIDTIYSSSSNSYFIDIKPLVPWNNQYCLFSIYDVNNPYFKAFSNKNYFPDSTFIGPPSTSSTMLFIQCDLDSNKNTLRFRNSLINYFNKNLNSTFKGATIYSDFQYFLFFDK